MTAEKSCFVVSPIGDEGSPVRKRANQVFRHIIAPVVEPRGYKPVRADQITRPGIITSQVLQEVADAELVVADLSGHNPNVFYELAIRHATQKPLVQLIGSDEELPFDIAAMRTIFFDIADLDSAERARTELDQHVAALEEHPNPVDTPIAAALGIKALRESEDPMAQTVAELAEQVAALRSEMARERQRGNIPTTIGASPITIPRRNVWATKVNEPLVLIDPNIPSEPFQFVVPDSLSAQAPPTRTEEEVGADAKPAKKRTVRRGTVPKKQSPKN
jgi:hypothetical protein